MAGEQHMLFVRVLFLTRPLKPLLYRIPKTVESAIALGTLVQVPLRTQLLWGIVQSIHASLPSTEQLDKVREVHRVYTIEPTYHAFIKRLARHHLISEKTLYTRLSALSPKAQKKKPAIWAPEHVKYNALPTLNQEQTEALTQIVENGHNDRLPVLLYGCTGSGKTLIYAYILQKAYHENRSSLLLAPEITLAQNLAHTLRSFLKNIPIYELHSAVPTKEKNRALKQILEKQPAIYIGVHIPLLLPIARLEVCIIDEEHDAGYQEKRFPYLHIKDVALMRHVTNNMQVIFGSATPSVVSLERAHQKHFRLVKLKKRFYHTALPHVESILLDAAHIRKEGWISPHMRHAIQETLDAEEQVLLFINRRGSHCFARCTNCKTTLRCTSCAVPCTVHYDHLLRCHHCCLEYPLPEICSCGGLSHLIERHGVGTQTIAQEAQKLFKMARIERIDLDSLNDKKRWPEIVQRMLSRDIQILVGTQMVTKGYHFPHLSLVGAIWADMHTTVPHYLAYEQTVQQLIQVAGRAGREYDRGKVIIQTLGDARLATFAHESTYPEFCIQEKEIRASFNNPPFSKLAHLILQNEDEAQLEKECAAVRQHAASFFQDDSSILLGPARALRYHYQGVFTSFFLARAPSYTVIQTFTKSLSDLGLMSRITYIPNPTSNLF